MLSMRLLDSVTILYSTSYYTVVASIFLVSAASCKAICRVALVRTSDSVRLETGMFPSILRAWLSIRVGGCA